MSSKLENIFNNYIKLVNSRFSEFKLKNNVKGPLRIITNEPLEIRRIVDHLEQEAFFQDLVKETISEFSWRYKTFQSNDLSDYDLAIKNFFRRSNYYYDIYHDKNINCEYIFNQYSLAFSRTNINVIYLAPIIGVTFADNIIDVGHFQLRKFSIDELESLFQNKTKEVFCPEKSFDMDLIDKLTKLWFITYVREYNPHYILSSFHCAWNIKSSYFIDGNDEYEEWLDDRIYYADGILEGIFPDPIINILKVFALFDWQTDIDKEERNRLADENDIINGNAAWCWEAFKIPFVLLLDDNLLAPNCRFIPELYRIESLYCNNDINLDEEDTSNFKEIINNIGKLISIIEDDQNRWQFLEIALTSMVKAFFTEGLEQLLWHMISLEALLGEKGEGVKERLARRISNILGRGEDEREGIRELFRDLYDFRSDLAHGNIFKKRVYTGHLWVARDLCRKVLLWFIHYLSTIQIIIKNNRLKNIASRKNILTLIDQVPTSSKHLTVLLDNLPDDFPYVKEWISP